MATAKTPVKKAKPAAKVVKPVKTAVKKSTTAEKAAPVAPKAKTAPKAVSSVRKDGGTDVRLVAPTGKSEKTVVLPPALFGDKVNKQLQAQAVRVYLANQREGSAHTKTRGEVEGSSKKIYKQKGTGNARHGTIRAPIFVKGGVALGPKAHDFHLDLPKKMKLKALSSALSEQVAHNRVVVLTDASKVEKKTKAFAALFASLELNQKTLFVTGSKEQAIVKFVRNIPYVTVISAKDLHTYAVMVQKHLCFTEAAVSELEARFKGENTL